MQTTTTSHTAEVALASLRLITDGETGDAVDRLIHPDCINHRNSGEGPGGRDGFRRVVNWINSGFGDLSLTPLDVIAVNDKAVIRLRFTGLHVGTFQGVAPTRQTVTFEQIHIFRTEDGMIAEHWMCMDELAALRQIGVNVPQRG